MSYPFVFNGRLGICFLSSLYIILISLSESSWLWVLSGFSHITSDQNFIVLEHLCWSVLSLANVLYHALVLL